MSNRHNTYFEIAEALDGTGCVVCRLSARSVRRHLEALSFESVNDLGLRAQLRRARGFCNRHAWMLLDEVRDPFGAGLIYRDVLVDCVRALERGDVAALASRDGCNACAAQTESAGRYVDVLVENLDSAAIAPRFERSGLCTAHLALGIARSSRGIGTLMSLQRTILAGLDQAEPRTALERRRQPAPGVRAGNAAPRAAPGDEARDPLVVLLAGMPGAAGPSIERLPSRDLPPPETSQRPTAPLPRAAGEQDAWDECEICRTGRAAARSAAAEIVQQTGTSLEVCPPHAWLAFDAAGPDATRSRLAPLAELLAERIDRAAPDVRRAAPIALGPLALSTPGARQARVRIAGWIAPGDGCAICQAQLDAEERAIASGVPPACRPHVLLAARLSAVERLDDVLARWQDVVADLVEYIRKNDYRFRDEPRGPEQRSPWRAVSLVGAGRGLR